MSAHAYPSDLAEFVRARWVELDSVEGAQTVVGGALPAPAMLVELFSVAYQATLLRDEERAVSFRLVLADPAAFPPEAGPPHGIHRLVFDAPRRFDEDELRRLSPAAKYHRSLIGVHANKEGALEIWGVLHSGPRWLHAANGGRGTKPVALTEALVIRATGPGRLAVARGEDLVGELRGGKLSGPVLDVFTSRWLPARFATSRDELAVLHEREREEAGGGWATIDPTLARRISQEMVKRLIATIRSAHHGGTVVFFTPDEVDELLETPNLVRIKYEFEDDEPRQRGRTLLLRALATVAVEAGASGVDVAGWEFYETASSQGIAAVEEAMFEMSHALAGFADVDGAVIMTTRFELLGFGAEIGALPEVRTVRRALDVEGEAFRTEAVEGVGTRHRSAYRLCQRFRHAVAIIVSQDGNVRIIAWHSGAVTYWDHASADWVDS